MFRCARTVVLSLVVVGLLFVPSEWGATVMGRAAEPTTATAVDAFEPDGTPAQASTIAPGVSQAHTFDVEGDVDWVRIVAVPGQTFTVATSNLGVDVDTVMTLYEEDAVTPLASNDDEGSDPESLASAITYGSTTVGIYYLKVSDFNDAASGAYTLTLTPLDDAFEVDDTAGQATVLLAGVWQAHNFNKDGDEDWVKFEVIAGRKYTVSATHLDDTVDTVMELYGPDGSTKIDENDDGPVDLGSRIVHTASQTGFYFARVLQFGGNGSGSFRLTLARDPGVYLNTDKYADVLTYSASSGAWARQESNGTGGFVGISGTWNPGWSVLPATFDADGRSDLFLFNTTTGQWAKMLNDGASGFTTQATGGWWPGWERYVIDLDGDGISDFFLYDPTTGVWFRCISTSTGFTYEQGGWNPGWEIYPVKLNADELGDLFLINRATGRWFWVLGDSVAGFFYPVSEVWFQGWVLYPGDFNGDGLTDFLLHDPPTGIHFVATTTDVGFTYVQGGWSLGWTPRVADLDGDGSDDLFLHDAATGKWFHMISDDAGHFVNAGGETWSQGWSLGVSDFNGDKRSDVLLYHPVTGVWYQALTSGPGTFAYSSGTWSPGLQVVVRPPIR